MPSIFAARAGRPLRPALAAATLLLAACTAGGSGSASAEPIATSSVDLPASYRFDPVAISVPVGSTVTWTNSDNFTHNVTFDGAEPLPMKPGEQASRVFDTAGTYPYLCSLHPKDMRGTVIVAAS